MKIEINITSDIMCPWCIIAYKRLERAMIKFEHLAEFNLHWYPFELNPRMPDDGQNLHQWLNQTYSMPKNEIISSRIELAEMGKELGFVFNYHDDTRMYNTFKAHQLLHWQGKMGDKQTDLKLALFKAHFTENKNISRDDVLIEVARKIGLNKEGVKEVLISKIFEDKVRLEEREIKKEGINAVPTFNFNKKYKVEGAQSSNVFEDTIERLVNNRE